MRRGSSVNAYVLWFLIFPIGLKCETMLMQYFNGHLIVKRSVLKCAPLSFCLYKYVVCVLS
jgi:hypothetical protein